MQTMTDRAYAHGYNSTVEKIENGATREAMRSLAKAAKGRKEQHTVKEPDFWIMVGIITAVEVQYGETPN